MPIKSKNDAPPHVEAKVGPVVGLNGQLQLISKKNIENCRQRTRHQMYKKWPYDKKFQNNFFLVFSNLQTKNWKEKCQKDGQFLDKHLSKFRFLHVF